MAADGLSDSILETAALPRLAACPRQRRQVVEILRMRLFDFDEEWFHPFGRTA
jgi:hypothetical protein